jgi:uncharacterized protein (DUF486 family)
MGKQLVIHCAAGYGRTGMMAAALLVAMGVDSEEAIAREREARPGSIETPGQEAQEVITLSVFIPFSIYYMQQPLKLDYLWAGLCIMGAVYFMFRNG